MQKGKGEFKTLRQRLVPRTRDRKCLIAVRGCAVGRETGLEKDDGSWKDEWNSGRWACVVPRVSINFLTPSREYKREWGGGP